MSIRSRRLIERQTRELGLTDLARCVEGACRSRVQAGPFAGMRTDIEALPLHVAPELLGSYEDELHVSGLDRPAGLEKLLRLGRALVVMNCEGAEFELLDPKAAPSLARAGIIVELHPNRHAAIEGTIIIAFNPTRSVERITPLLVGGSG